MDTNRIMTLGLGLEEPWKVLKADLELQTQPTRLLLEVGADRGSLYPCPECGTLCRAHDFKEFSWQHLNFFQHQCIITARVPRVDCPHHGIHRVKVPWARPESGFTLLFEQAVLVLAREMPVAKVAEITGVNDTRIWRILMHYIGKALEKFDLSNLRGFGVDETASKRGHNYVTIFVDMDKDTHPVIFAVPGKGSETFEEFKKFLKEHKGEYGNVSEIVCDMSPSFLSAAKKEFPHVPVTVDWFHVVQTFTKAVDEVRKLEGRSEKLPSGTRWATLKSKETARTKDQADALKELEEKGLETSIAFQIKEKLRWVREADSKPDARWRADNFLKTARELAKDSKYLKPIIKALDTFERHKEQILARWESMMSNARLESLNSLFQAARTRARGYRNTQTFIAMIYLIASPVQELLFPR